MQRKIKHIRAFVLDNWKVVLLATTTIGFLGLLLVFKLGSLVGGLSGSEYQLQQLIAHDGLGLGTVARDALFLPYNFMLYLLQFTPFTGPTGVRLTGVLFGLLGAAGMFYIFRTWYTTRVAMLGTILFATSSWFIHAARFADPAVSYLLLPLLVAAMIALQSKVRSRLAIAAVVVFGMAMMYLPGVVLFIIPALIIKRKVILASFKAQPIWYKITLGLISVIMLIPLLLTLVRPLPGVSTLSNAFSLFGFPGTDLHSIYAMISQLRESLLGIFAYSNAGALYTPGHMPWFDICTSVLAIIGIVQFARYWRLDRSKLIGIAALLSIILIALGGAVSSVVLLPFLFLFVVEGLKWLLETWLEVFPKNPFARSFAIIMICLLTASVVSFHINKYYLAWGRAPETRQVFNNIP